MADVVGWMCEAKEIIIVPGFGLCQGQAQYATAEISKILNKHGVRLRFGIHPVAGISPLPGYTFPRHTRSCQAKGVQ